MQLPSRLHDKFKVLPSFRSCNVAVIDVSVLFHIDVLEWALGALHCRTNMFFLLTPGSTSDKRIWETVAFAKTVNKWISFISFVRKGNTLKHTASPCGGRLEYLHRSPCES
jgi:hypothetical protein